jgi:uncharacterized protein
MSLLESEIATLEVQLQQLPKPISFMQAHGLITAVACSPSAHTPTTWLSYLLGASAPQQLEIARVLLRLYTDITHSLYSGQNLLPQAVVNGKPQRWQASDTFQTWQPWCIAFLSWVGVNKDWAHSHDHKQIDNLLYPLLTIASTYEQYCKVQAKAISLEEFQNLCQSHHQELPIIIQRIYYYWQNHTGCFHSHTATPVAHKVGRNDLCPCGSGKKYKRCCDLATV